MRAAVLLLLAVSCQAAAQSPVTLMPEGSSEGSAGLVYGEAWARRGSNARKAFVIPWFSMQWSNGAFVEGLSAGWKLSEEVHFQYGPVIGLSTPAQGAGGSQLTPGGFVLWRVLHNVEVAAQAGVGARDGRVKADLALNWAYSIDADHSLVLQAAAGNDEGWNHRLGARWSWRLGRRHTLMSSVTGIRLAGSSAHAPGIERRSSVAVSAALLYRF
ncbi:MULTISPECIES: hypothetical protein [unclassified Duganella]|uniref:hypothetical protein n=1 Tax=unclassified Duganella TaxID=2636909 RepID=UPI0006F5E4C5|nr:MULTISPECIES: hypothetical protein [unclassified Duganella]KQV55393.1 hypothetical protein ASD07_28035 [Duganella sp. Root336D2]KRB95846.1 hypothetical protein ASE26_26175 [Duganella sp. Root198D2]